MKRRYMPATGTCALTTSTRSPRPSRAAGTASACRHLTGMRCRSSRWPPPGRLVGPLLAGRAHGGLAYPRTASRTRIRCPLGRDPGARLHSRIVRVSRPFRGTKRCRRGAGVRLSTQDSATSARWWLASPAVEILSDEKLELTTPCGCPLRHRGPDAVEALTLYPRWDDRARFLSGLPVRPQRGRRARLLASAEKV